MLVGRDLVPDLYPCHSFQNSFQFLTSIFEPWWKHRFDFGFLLEDKRREKRNHFLGLVGCQSVVQNELGENEFINRIDLIVT